MLARQYPEDEARNAAILAALEARAAQEAQDQAKDGLRAGLSKGWPSHPHEVIAWEKWYAENEPLVAQAVDLAVFFACNKIRLGWSGESDADENWFSLILTKNVARELAMHGFCWTSNDAFSKSSRFFVHDPRTIEERNEHEGGPRAVITQEMAAGVRLNISDRKSGNNQHSSGSIAKVPLALRDAVLEGSTFWTPKNLVKAEVPGHSLCRLVADALRQGHEMIMPSKIRAAMDGLRPALARWADAGGPGAREGTLSWDAPMGQAAFKEVMTSLLKHGAWQPWRKK